MRKPTIAIIAVAAALLAGAGVFLKSPDPVGYHLRELHSLRRSRQPRTFADYFKPAIWEWYFQGRPNFTQLQKRINEHYRGLVLLGYFGTRDFKLTNRTADISGMREFYALTTNIAFNGDAMWTTVPGYPSIIRVTADREDMRKLESVVMRFESKDAR